MGFQLLLGSRFSRLGYTSFGNQQKAAFPDIHTDWKELLYFRNWQASGLVMVYYYFMIFVAFFVFISEIVIQTIASKVAGFFLGFFVGLIYLFGIIIISRLGGEIVLSIFSIRDHIALSSQQMPTKTTSTLLPQGAIPTVSTTDSIIQPLDSNSSSILQANYSVGDSERRGYQNI